MDVFVLLCTVRGTGQVLLVYINLDGLEINRYDISHVAKAASCCDIDQNRKELVIGSRMKDGGRLQSYSLRCVEPSHANSKRHYIAVFRLQAKMTEASGRKLLQLCTQDTGGASLVLTDGGGISAYQTGTLESLWFIPFTAFKYEPSRLWVDKFGSDFAVLCTETIKKPTTAAISAASAADNSTSKDGSASTGQQQQEGRELLELWHPPTKFAAAEAGEFSRGVLPLDSSRLTGLILETQSPFMGTFVVYMTENGAVRLWRSDPAGSSGGYSMDPVLVLDAVSSYGSGSDKGVTLLSAEQQQKQQQQLSRHGEKALLSFVFNPGMPDCPISVLLSRGTLVSRIALHPPSDMGGQYRRNILELSLMQMQTKRPQFKFIQSVGAHAPTSVDQFFAAKQEEDEITEALTMQYRFASEMKMTQAAAAAGLASQRNDANANHHPNSNNTQQHHPHPHHQINVDVWDAGLLGDMGGGGSWPIKHHNGVFSDSVPNTADGSSVTRGGDGGDTGGDASTFGGVSARTLASASERPLNLESRQSSTGTAGGDVVIHGSGGRNNRQTSSTRPNAEGAAELLRALGAELAPHGDGYDEVTDKIAFGGGVHVRPAGSPSTPGMHDADKDRPNTNYLSERVYSEFSGATAEKSTAAAPGSAKIEMPPVEIAASVITNDDVSVGSEGTLDSHHAGALTELNSRVVASSMTKPLGRDGGGITSETPPALASALVGLDNPVHGAIPLHLTRGSDSGMSRDDEYGGGGGGGGGGGSYDIEMMSGSGFDGTTGSVGFTPLNRLRGYATACDDPAEADGVGLMRMVNPPSLVICEHGVYLPPMNNNGNNGSSGNAADGSINASGNDTSNSGVTQKIKRPLDMHPPRVLGEQGLVRVDSRSASDGLLEVSLSGVAHRMCAIGVISVMNQALLFDLRPEVEPTHTINPYDGPKPITMELDLRQKAKATAMLVADVSITYSAQKRAQGRMVSTPASVDGQHALCFFGDTDGKLNFAVCNRTISIQTSSFVGHNGVPIVAISATGHAAQAMWRVSAMETDLTLGGGGKGKNGGDTSNSSSRATTATSKKGSARSGKSAKGGGKAADARKRLVPTTCAGSAIVSVGKDGEVKVWQPVFEDLGGVTTNPASVFTVASIEWRQVGTFVCRIPMEMVRQKRRTISSQALDRVRGSATAVALDPTCTTLIVSFSDGSIQQWPIPGLLDTRDGGLCTEREALCRVKKHSMRVSGLRVMVSGGGIITPGGEVTSRWEPGSINEDPPRSKDAGAGDDDDDDSSNKRGSSTINSSNTGNNTGHHSAAELKAAMDPVATYIKGNIQQGVRGVSYSFKQMRALSERSSMVTSGDDFSAVLWTYAMERSSNDRDRKNQFLMPSPVRRFLFSGVPHEALCFDVSSSTTRLSKSLWRVSAVSSGTVVTAFQGNHDEMFQKDHAFLAIDFDGSSSSNSGDSVAEVKDGTSSASNPKPDPALLATKYRMGHNQRMMLLPVHGVVDRPSLTAEVMSKKASSKDGSYIWDVLDTWTSRAVPEPTNLTSQQFAVDANVIFDGVISRDIISKGETWEPSLSPNSRVVRTTDMSESLAEGAKAAILAKIEAGGDATMVKPLHFGDENTDAGYAYFVQDGVKLKVPEAGADQARFTTAQQTGVRHTVEILPVPTVTSPGPTSPPPLHESHESMNNGGDLMHTDLGPSVSAFHSSMLHTVTDRAPLVLPPTRLESETKTLTALTDTLETEADGQGGVALLDGNSLQFNDSFLEEDSVSLNSAGTASKVAQEQERAHAQEKARLKAVVAASNAVGATAAATGTAAGGTNQPSSPGAASDLHVGEGGFGAEKSTRAQQLRAKKLAERLAREAAVPTSQKTTQYTSKPRKNNGETPSNNSTRQIAGNAVTFTVPLNFDATQRTKAENKVIVDKGTSKARRGNQAQTAGAGAGAGGSTGGLVQKKTHAIPNAVHKADTITLSDSVTNLDMTDADAAAIAAEGQDGLGMLTVSLTEPRSGPNDLHPLHGSTNPFYFDRNAKSVYYRNNSRRAPKFVPRASQLPFVDPALVPEVDDKLSLMGAQLLGTITEKEALGLDVLVDQFTEKDMDAFEALLDDSKLMVLDEIGCNVQIDGVDPQTCAKRGLALMKRLILQKKAELLKSRKDGAATALVLADPNVDCDVLIQQDAEKVEKTEATLSLSTPNLGAIAVLFAVEVPKDRSTEGSGDEEKKDDTNSQASPTEAIALPPVALLDSYQDIAEVKSVPGIASASALKLPDGKNEFTLSLTDLKPGRKYKVYCYLRCTQTDEEARTFSRMTPEDIQGTEETITTAEEEVDICWTDLDAAGRDEEIRAAMRTSYVIAAVDADPTVHLITDADMLAREPNSSAGRAAIKKVEMFTKWWAPKDVPGGLSAIRRQFLFFEALYALCNMDLTGKAENRPPTRTATADGDEEKGEVADMIEVEQNKAAGYLELGLISPAKFATLRETAKAILESGPEQARSIEDTALAGNRDFFNFKSWYKGGQELFDFEESLFLNGGKNSNNPRRQSATDGATGVPGELLGTYSVILCPSFSFLFCCHGLFISLSLSLSLSLLLSASIC
jgi:hypothetical protein